MARTASFYTDRALAAFNAGFTSKSAKQSALADLNSAYEIIRRKFHSDMCSAAPAFPADGIEYPAERVEFLNAREVPFDLHLVRDRHITIFADNGADATTVSQLVELRVTIKGADINAPVRAEPSAFEVKVRETIAQLMERRQAQFLSAIDLCNVVADGVRIAGLSANSHYVTNDHGTTFIRTFFYLNGKLTPLNVIIAAAEEAKRREEGK
jgi:hypothetical protein